MTLRVARKMATGRRAFSGQSHASIVAAIMAAEPQPISAVQPMSPPALDASSKAVWPKTRTNAGRPHTMSSCNCNGSQKGNPGRNSGSGQRAPQAVTAGLETESMSCSTALIPSPRRSLPVGFLPRFGDHKAYPLISTEFNNTYSQFSPDGRWVAYDSDASGKDEIYAVAFPNATARFQISTAGGGNPQWRQTVPGQRAALAEHLASQCDLELGCGTEKISRLLSAIKKNPR